MIRLAFFVVAPILAVLAQDGGQRPAEYVNAGIFPYSTASGEVKVLLGFDGDRESWSDFVGTCTPGETPPDTAAREFVEETRNAYPFDEILGRLGEALPVEIGPTRLFLLEIPEISATRLSRLSKSRNSEKIEYCWVPLNALLASIDDRGPNRAEVPAACGGSSRELFEIAAQNLAAGQELRQRLFTAPDEQPTRSSMSNWPRCGR